MGCSANQKKETIQSKILLLRLEKFDLIKAREEKMQKYEKLTGKKLPTNLIDQELSKSIDTQKRLMKKKTLNDDQSRNKESKPLHKMSTNAGGKDNAPPNPRAIKINKKAKRRESNRDDEEEEEEEEEDEENSENNDDEEEEEDEDEDNDDEEDEDNDDDDDEEEEEDEDDDDDEEEAESNNSSSNYNRNYRNNKSKKNINYNKKGKTNNKKSHNKQYIPRKK